MPLEKVFGIMQKDAPRALDGECVEALIAAETNLESTSKSLQGLSRSVENTENKSIPEEKRESLTAVR
jgi:hypothetical protein